MIDTDFDFLMLAQLRRLIKKAEQHPSASCLCGHMLSWACPVIAYSLSLGM